MNGEDELTQEERIAYLRERGVKIDFPVGDEGAGASITSPSDTNTVFQNNTSQIKRKVRIVHVPADDSVQCKEIEGKEETGLTQQQCDVLSLS